MTIKQELREVVDSKGEHLYDYEQAMRLCRDALAEIERLEQRLANLADTEKLAVAAIRSNDTCTELLRVFATFSDEQKALAHNLVIALEVVRLRAAPPAD